MLNDGPRLASTEQRRRKDNAVKWNVVFSHEIVQLHLVFHNKKLTIKLFTIDTKTIFLVFRGLSFTYQEDSNEWVEIKIPLDT